MRWRADGVSALNRNREKEFRAAILRNFVAAPSALKFAQPPNDGKSESAWGTRAVEKMEGLE